MNINKHFKIKNNICAFNSILFEKIFYFYEKSECFIININKDIFFINI